MKTIKFISLFLILFSHLSYALHPTTVTNSPQHLKRGFEYMLKPNQAMVVSIIKVNEKWHVVLIEGESLCPAFSNVLDAVNQPSSICNDIKFYISKTDSGEDGVFVTLN